MAHLRPVTISLLVLAFNFVYGQKEAANWYFGNKCGINFNSGDPIPQTNGKLKSIHGCAAISDRLTGALLFYTDGRNFWNRNHELMKNDHTLPVGCFALITQPVIIIPSMENEFLFHVFCIMGANEIPPPATDADNCVYALDKSALPEGESGLNLFYYLVDMRLENGLGNVVEDQSHILIATNITEKLTAVPHLNGRDYWVLVHGWKNNLFHAYHLATGRIIGEVITAIGSVHGDYGGIYFEEEAKGELKPSPDGKKIASAVYESERPFDLFDFNSSTGTLSNYINLGNIRGQYGVSFSPDNSKLYVSSDSRDNTSSLPQIVLQYDLSAGDSTSIVSSEKSLIINNPDTNIPDNGIFDGWSTVPKGMALALDGRLYISANEPRDQIEENHTLVVIDRPNESGFESNINFRRFDFGLGETGVGLPNHIQSYFNGLMPTSACAEASILTIFPNPTPDVFHVRLLEGCYTEYYLTIINSLGQKVSPQIKVLSGDVVDLSSYADGLYTMIFEPPGQKVVVKKVIKRSGNK